jgi:hypothetical protein
MCDLVAAGGRAIQPSFGIARIGGSAPHSPILSRLINEYGVAA